MAQHTPGEWGFGENGKNVFGGDIDIRILDADGYPIAELPYEPILDGYGEKLGVDHWALHEDATRERSEEEMEANAHLIAAAPDMLSNGVEFDRLCLVIESAVRNADPANLDAVVALIHANRAAIAKAEPKAEGRS